MKYPDDKNLNIESTNVQLNLKDMEIESKDGEDLYFGTIEHLDNAQLKFFIKEEDALFIRSDQEAYI